MEAAIWGAELAHGDGAERIYIVEPTGEIVDDPNLTDRKFPGNPTQSYRSREPLRVIGEVSQWTGHSAERLKEMKDQIERLKEEGVEAID
nr:NAD(+)--rifampin ADP-ribosyltransferase [Bradyrhizobium canariense]